MRRARSHGELATAGEAGDISHRTAGPGYVMEIRDGPFGVAVVDVFRFVPR